MSSSTVYRKVARCSVPDCSKQVQTRKLCKAHGGGVRCRGPNCPKLAQSGGLCVAHGGGRRCGFEDCNKLAQYKGLCLSHGGGRRCRVIGCQKYVQIRGCCKAHEKSLAEEIGRQTPAATVVYPTTAAPKFDTSFTCQQQVIEQDTRPRVISQDPAARVFTAPRRMGTMTDHDLYKQRYSPVRPYTRVPN
ncbi:hypothetical protein GN958_ATG08059 [Phytophthora infestans]|uniref:WRKY19-like zinc finger domain-containing protein n=1 Tax=Phytophthora infestans TaxID=4787 RepID=A0A8S9USW1_PHYIN|nr:hypothetical protein GN958_ATG08059 [Phytophthora infestans]